MKHKNKIKMKLRKKPLFWMLSISILLVSCLQETKEKMKKTTQEIKAATTLVENAQTVQDQAMKLAEKTPLSNEQLKSWLPNTIMGMERSAFKVGNMAFTGAASIKGTYKEEDKQFVVEVVDGAGSMGGMVIMAGVAARVDMEEDNEFQHMKTLERNGIQAKQTYYKKQNKTQLLFLYDDRFLVEINGDGMGVDETWQAVGKLNLKDLKE